MTYLFATSPMTGQLISAYLRPCAMACHGYELFNQRLGFTNGAVCMCHCTWTNPLTVCLISLVLARFHLLYLSNMKIVVIDMFIPNSSPTPEILEPPKLPLSTNTSTCLATWALMMPKPAKRMQFSAAVASLPAGFISSGPSGSGRVPAAQP